jgi:hypothetical protein
MADYVRMVNEVHGLGIPLAELPNIGRQNRRAPAERSLQDDEICGADTETIAGRVWLFSSEYGVWETNDLGGVLEAIFDPEHLTAWRRGANSKPGKDGNKGLKVVNFFFWNLKFDAQAIMGHMDDLHISSLLDGDKVQIWAEVFGSEVCFEFRYLEGKHMEIKPLKWRIDGHQMGSAYLWDISQFFHKIRLNTAAKRYLDRSKVEECFDGSTLDASRFDEEEYRMKYRDDIIHYAKVDADLAGELTRLKAHEFISQNIRFIRPYSLANLAQRTLIDDCKVPTLSQYVKEPSLNHILKIGLSAYTGGWFETVGTGFFPEVVAQDLTSAYPYVMNFLPNTDDGTWFHDYDEEAWWDWMGEREPFSLGFAEVFVEFEEGLPWFPLTQKSSTGTLVAPRIISGWFTADEICEAKKWPHVQFHVGEWCYFVPNDPEEFVYRPFIEKFYRMKKESIPGSVEYAVSKVLINSAYGKLIQAVDGKAGALYNPFHAATITGATRARLAEINRLNGFSALSFATDGVIFPKGEIVVPERPREAIYDLGGWESDGEGSLAVIMSGVYSIRGSDYTKTTFRGSASYFLRNYTDGGIFRFCEENGTMEELSVTVKKPVSGKEARMKGDFSRMNVFEERTFTIRPVGDSTKRRNGEVPQNFGELLTRWFPSHPHEVMPGALL